MTSPWDSWVLVWPSVGSSFNYFTRFHCYFHQIAQDVKNSPCVLHFHFYLTRDWMKFNWTEFNWMRSRFRFLFQTNVRSVIVNTENLVFQGIMDSDRLRMLKESVHDIIHLSNKSPKISSVTKSTIRSQQLKHQSHRCFYCWLWTSKYRQRGLWNLFSS